MRDDTGRGRRVGHPGVSSETNCLNPSSASQPVTGGEAAVQGTALSCSRPFTLTLIHMHARNKPSTVHVQNQARPSPTNLGLLFLLPLFIGQSDPQSPCHQSLCDHVSPSSACPSQSIPQNVKGPPPPQAPKSFLGCISPPLLPWPFVC